MNHIAGGPRQPPAESTLITILVCTALCYMILCYTFANYIPVCCTILYYTGMFGWRNEPLQIASGCSLVTESELLLIPGIVEGHGRSDFVGFEIQGLGGPDGICVRSLKAILSYNTINGGLYKPFL